MPAELGLLRVPEELVEILTIRFPFAGVLISDGGSGFSSADLSLLAGRLDCWCRCVDREKELERRFEGWIWLRVCGVLLSLTTLFLCTGLVPCSLAGLDVLDILPSAACPPREARCLPPDMDDMEAPNWLARLRVRGGEGGRSIAWAADSDRPSFRSALVRALSFIGTGISSSELSSLNWLALLWDCIA
jgi:hypothetical protein